jgi:hypothetical protein
MELGTSRKMRNILSPARMKDSKNGKSITAKSVKSKLTATMNGKSILHPRNTHKINQRCKRNIRKCHRRKKS